MTEAAGGVGAAPPIGYELDPAGRLTWHGPLARLLGGDGAAPPTLEAWLAHVAVDDRARLRAALEERRAAPNRAAYRVARADGGLIEVVDTGTALTDGRRVGLVALAVEPRRAPDVPPGRLAAPARVAAALRLIFWTIDRDGRVTAASGQAVGDVDPVTLVGRTLDQVPGATPAGMARANRALGGEVVEETALLGDRVVRFHWFPARDAHGVIVGAHGFALDLTEHVQAEQARDAADEHLHLIAENMVTVVWVATPTFDQIFYVSPSFERVFGQPVAALMADPGRWPAMIHPEDRDRVIAVAQACPWQQDQRHRVVWPDGTIRWIEVHVRPVRDAHGEVIRAVGTAEDVTAAQTTLDALQRTGSELLRSLDEKDTLLREIHHRVRNNLQVIQSLLNLQLRAVADPAVRRVLGDSQRRVQAMALVQDYLYDGRDLRRVALGAYLRRLLAALASAQGDALGRIELRTDVCEVNVDTETAIHLGIAVTELVSNAFEHAFPEGRDGAIRVRTAIDAGRLQIDVEDDGVGFPAGFELVGGSSLGLTLVQTLVAHVRGELRIEPCGGACFRIELRLDGG